jgi:GGDEF domain-containing protein
MADPPPDGSTERRPQPGPRRVEQAALRDGVAYARDQSALLRDLHATLRDRAMNSRDAAWAGEVEPVPAADAVLDAADQRRHAAADRVAAAEGRAWAADDREQAILDREQGARDRSQAHADRDALLNQLRLAQTDQLTGARTRAAGVEDLADEVDWARRTAGQLVVAYVAVAGLSAVNHGDGRAAGDDLLTRTVRSIEGRLEAHHSVTRLSGGAFLCLMPGASPHDASARLGGLPPALAIELDVGFAALAPGEDGDELVDRAQAAALINRASSSRQSPTSA